MKKLLITLVLGLAAATTARAAWPDKPVTLLVPFPAGGSTDLIARALAPKLQEKLGGTFIIDNRPGGGGTVGATAAKRSAPDGYTILVSSLGPFVIGPHLVKGVQYDALKDFDYITVAEGGAPAMTDLLGGQVDANFMNINTGFVNIKAGRLRALAITSAKRSPLLPDLPTMEESGIKDVTVYSWQAFAAPKGLPADIKIKLRDAIVAGLKDPQVKPKLLELGLEIVGNTPEQFTAFQASEFARWKKVIEVGKITAD